MSVAFEFRPFRFGRADRPQGPVSRSVPGTAQAEKSGSLHLWETSRF